MSEWNPIETAPKDGTQILVYNPVTGPYSSRFDKKTDSFPLGFWDRFGEWHPSPSHWMPLPEPPKGGDAT